MSWYQKDKTKTNVDFLEQETVSGSDISWAACKSAPRSRQITMPATHHSFFTGQMPFLLPSQQCQSTEDLMLTWQRILLSILSTDNDNTDCICGKACQKQDWSSDVGDCILQRLLRLGCLLGILLKLFKHYVLWLGLVTVSLSVLDLEMILKLSLSSAWTDTR